MQGGDIMALIPVEPLTCPVDQVLEPTVPRYQLISQNTMAAIIVGVLVTSVSHVG